MTSLIAEYRFTEVSIRELTARLECLKKDPSLQDELDFEIKLKDLMGTYSKNLSDITAIMDPQNKFGKEPNELAGKKGRRAPRQLKRYRNPHTGEIVETKGGNNKTLKLWNSEHGAVAVKSWLL